MVDNRRMANPDRLTGLDASFLALEDSGAHMHVGSCLIFEGPAPGYDDFVDQIEDRLHLVPRYRQRLAFPPLAQARPVWIDDPHFNPGYHVRHTALPEPASLEQLRNLSGRVLAQRLDRTKPLWELWLVDKVEGDRFAVITKTHHCLVDGISGVDIATVLFDAEPGPARRRRSHSPMVPAARAERRHAGGRRAGRARRRPAGLRARRRRGDRAARARGRTDRPRGRRARRDAVGGPAGRPREPLQHADRPAPAVSRGSTATSPTSRRSSRRSAAPSTTSC